ncbi:M16 family metallopeptidase [Blattabacterium cuenoti]|uniref:M16 family metallopeptidase n=1 Tax=Blattabacterium cuenoti TaxID=1653831 RepID=UPI00163C608C|nr:pitrilysin family protein [Blattabacterium cuenoti]
MHTKETINIAPKPLKSKIDFKIKRPSYFQKLKNGLRVVLIEDHKFPTVRIILELDTTPFLEKEKTGIKDVFGKMLRSGTKNYSKDELDELIDYNLGTGLYSSFYEISVSILKKNLVKSITILMEILTNCNFKNNKELDKIIKQKITEIVISENNPNDILRRIKNLFFYGKDHPYGEYETIDSVQRITLHELKRLYKKYYLPNRFYLSFIGDIYKDEVKYLCRKYFSKWKKKPYVEKRISEKKFSIPNELKVNIIDMPFLNQSCICLGMPIILKMNDPSYLPAVLANSILGEGPYSRLFLNLREEKAYTYGIYSVLKSDKNIGCFSVYTQVRNEVTAKSIRDILQEISDFKLNKKSIEEELYIKKKEIIGQFLLDLENPEKINDIFMYEKKDGISYNFHDNYIENISSIEIDEIYQIYKKFFPLNRGIIIIIGNAKEILPSIRKLGYPINYFDKFGNLLEKNV